MNTRKHPASTNRCKKKTKRAEKRKVGSFCCLSVWVGAPREKKTSTREDGAGDRGRMVRVAFMGSSIGAWKTSVEWCTHRESYEDDRITDVAQNRLLENGEESMKG